jgi:hypothetical protein
MQAKRKNPPLFESYYRPDRFEAYKGLPNLKCMFCGKCSPIPFDMDLHLYEEHKRHLFTNPVFRDKGLVTLDERIDYLLELMKDYAIKNRMYFGSKNSQEELYEPLR